MAKPTGTGKGFFGDLFGKLGAIFTAIGNFLKSFWDSETKFFQFFFSLQDSVEKARQQIDDFKHWEFDVDQFRTRVISVPRAWEQVKELKADVVDLYTGKLQKLEGELKQFLAQFQPSSSPPVGADADALANTSLKINQVVAALNAVATILEDILDFTQAIDDIKKKLQDINTFTLQQGNSRVRLKKTISARVGKLHAGT
jgi:hypothetical protein